MKSDSKKRLSLSKKGEELVEHYKNMVNHGYQRTDGIYVKDTYDSFELKNSKNSFNLNLNIGILKVYLITVEVVRIGIKVVVLKNSQRKIFLI